MDYDRILQAFAAGLRDLIPHDHLDIVLLHPSGTQICHEACLHTSWSRRDDRKPTDTSPIRDVLRGDAPFFLTGDAWTDARFHFDGADSAPIFRANLHSRIVVPLRVEGEIIGSLAISSHHADRYDTGMVETAQGAADLISSYLFALERGREARESAVAESEARGREEALRIGAQRLTEGIETERQRLAMDIHDQTLADMARLARRVSQLAPASRTQAAEIDGIRDDLDRCLADLRGVVEDMKPTILQLFGFSEAVEAHLERCAATAPGLVAIAIEDVSGGAVDRLPDSVRTALYRIVQEAGNNAIRHGAASQVGVTAECAPGALVITVRDNGSGIGAQHMQSANGIANIRTRAALISARVVIEGLPSGTRVRITLPVQDLMQETRQCAF
ncbi:GAF domain-containing sensor histidine kinase [Halovulum sp. GXIMD14794]